MPHAAVLRGHQLQEDQRPQPLLTPVVAISQELPAGRPQHTSTAFMAVSSPKPWGGSMAARTAMTWWLLFLQYAQFDQLPQ